MKKVNGKDILTFPWAGNREETSSGPEFVRMVGQSPGISEGGPFSGNYGSS